MATIKETVVLKTNQTRLSQIAMLKLTDLNRNLKI